MKTQTTEHGTISLPDYATGDSAIVPAPAREPVIIEIETKDGSYRQSRRTAPRKCGYGYAGHGAHATPGRFIDKFGIWRWRK